MKADMTLEAWVRSAPSAALTVSIDKYGTFTSAIPSKAKPRKISGKASLVAAEFKGRLAFLVRVQRRF